MEKNSAANLLTSIDSLFTTQQERDLAAQPRVEEISLDLIDDFPDHPFKVRMDESMTEMADSIKQYGVLVPAIVRQKEDGRYEMVAGHRRKAACELAGKTKIPCVVRELTLEEAVVVMVDSNLQREQILPSEKAFAYKMKLDAMKRQVGRPRNSAPLGPNLIGSRSNEELAMQSSDNLTLGRDIKPSLNALAQTTVTFLKGNLAPAVKNIVTALPGAVGTLVTALIPGNMQGIVSSAVSNFTTFMTTSFPTILANGTAMITQLMAGFQSGIPGMIASTGSLITQVMNAIAMNLPGMLQSGTSILLQLVTGFLSAVPSLLTAAGTMIQQLLTTLMTSLPSMISTGASFILNLASGLISSLPNIVSSATTIVSNLLTTFASHLPDLLAQGISMIGQLVAGLISMIPDVISTALDIGSNIINTFGEIDWISIGKNIISGIISGIWDAAGSLFSALKDLASQALQAAKDALGIHSPSTVFRNLVGRFIPAGAAQGVLDKLSLMKSAVRQMSAVASDNFTAALRMDTKAGRGTSGGNLSGGRGVTVIQYIYSQAKTAADLMQEARYQAEMAVLLGV